MKQRLERLENILKQRSTGSNYEYLQAIQRETDRIRGHLESVISVCGKGDKPWPELEPANPKDVAIIESYESVHPYQTEPGNRNGRLGELLSGIKREVHPKDNGARERVENKIVSIHKRLKAGE